MIITTLKEEHIKEASKLAFDNYLEERRKIETLPEIKDIPDLSWFVENGYGVAAIDNDELLGFIACFNPWDGAFDSKAKGTFTPIHAHGCVKENRAKIYEMMYQKMAEKLVEDGVLYHGIALYEHDSDAIRAYFHNGFGHRCADAIRKMEQLPNVKCVPGISFEEIASEDVRLVRSLRRALSEHLGESSCFMYSTEEQFQEWIERKEKNESRIFVAKEEEKIIAFIEISDDGENFVTDHAKMKNICGAFCLLEYRGKQMFQNLLNYLIEILQKEGYQYLGVDYESFNPTAFHFWGKNFEAYTCSVTRRIDEGILRKYTGEK